VSSVERFSTPRLSGEIPLRALSMIDDGQKFLFIIARPLR
jgi:hypothetical protein